METPFPKLKTKRFILNDFNEYDLQNIFYGLSHPDVIKYYGVHYNSLEATKEQLTWFKMLQQEEKGLWWAIRTHENSTFVGAAGINDWDKTHKKAEIGFWLLPEHWGHGIIREVLLTICRYAFNAMDLHRI